ncbi:MAG: hypothetical protein ACYC96_11015 [Fimbriimonadaceae bacterium]
MLLCAFRLNRFVGLGLLATLAAFAPAQIVGLSVWSGYGANAQHTGQSTFAAGVLNFKQWHIPVDTNPTYSGNDLLIHYGEPAITPLGNVVISVRHGTSSPFTIEGHGAVRGSLIWSATSSFIQPGADWTPSVGPVLLPATFRAGLVHSNFVTLTPLSTRVAWPESGGRISIRSNADATGGYVATHAFYGDDIYAANSANLDANVKVCTPLTAGPDGSVYFGYYVEGANNAGLQSGLAVIRPNGRGSMVTAQSMAGGDLGIDRVQFNCAPAISNDGRRVYVAVSAGYWGRGYLVAVNTQSLLPQFHVALKDPLNQQPASVTSDSTSSPLIAPDGSVFFGVLENSLGTNNFRGYMLHFSYDLSQTLTPGEFGWDNTGSIIPTNWIPNYKSASPYLVVCKYNNYAGAGSGDGVNKIAVLDPSTAQLDNANSVAVMGEVRTITGLTPDTANRPRFPNAVREWCINSIAVDMHNKIVILNSEDGWAYAWNLGSNTVASKINLTSGIGEAYTSTAIGPNGNVYAISNGTLFAINTFPPPP